MKKTSCCWVISNGVYWLGVRKNNCWSWDSYSFYIKEHKHLATRFSSKEEAFNEARKANEEGRGPYKVYRRTSK